MTVRELIEALKAVDPDALVILAKDGEGNGFSPCADCDTDRRYEADSTWSGELVSHPEEAEDEDDADPERWDQAAICVVLWPTN